MGLWTFDNALEQYFPFRNFTKSTESLGTGECEGP